MKKILLLIIGVLLFVPSILFADMGSPMIDEYKATVSNKDGAAIYDYTESSDEKVPTGEVIPYGKTVTVTMEEEGFALLEGYGDVKVTDITAIEKNYKMIDKEWKKAQKSIVLKKVELRKGPAYGYETTGITIEPGTIVTIRTFNEQGFFSWVYVEYKGNKGFVDSFNGTLTVDEGTGTFICYSDTEVKDATTGEQIGTLKANSVISGKYYVLDPWSRAYYFEKDDFIGVIEESNVVFETHDKEYVTKGTLKRDIKLYESIDSEKVENSKVVTTLKKGTKIQTNIYVNFGALSIYYYENGDVKGWIYDEDIMTDNDEDYDKPEYGFALEKDDDMKLDQTKMMTLKENIIFDKTQTTQTEPQDTPQEIIPQEDIITPSTREDVPYEKVFMGVVIALIICVVIAVVIILINRSRK